ncbi:MAG: hypothetical protein JXR87_02115, partial [Candidatus Marinimicrobia bacterium]|nr:hypothetical protein [Candidatus Neomarinimicrobiota bacterium]
KEWNKERWNLATREIFDRIMSHYEESNRKLAVEYFNREHLFFEPFEEAIKNYTIGEFPSNELLELNSYIIERLNIKETTSVQLSSLLKENALIQKSRTLINR